MSVHLDGKLNYNTTQDLQIESSAADRYIPARHGQPVPRLPGNSPDMNVVEKFGSVIMDVAERSQERVTKDMMCGFIEGSSYLDH